LTLTFRRCIVPALTAVWIALAGAGLWVLYAYENRPGAAATAPQRWPAATRLGRADGRPTLVFLAHPRCSCTRASLTELAEVLARATTPLKTYVVFIRPDGFEPNWEKTDIWRRAQALPGVTVTRDDGGSEATVFGAATSGQTLLYDARGTLLFSGGITGARGHEGENAGELALITAINGSTPRDSAQGQRRARSNVFGCALFSRSL
jgi:hypothetical protein